MYTINVTSLLTLVFSHEQTSNHIVFIRICETWQTSLLLQIYSNNQPKADRDCKLGVHTAALDILADTHAFLPITECTFLADKDYDVKDIYNKVRELYDGECIIPLNRRNAKNPKLLPQRNPVCEAGLAMWKDSKFSDNGRTRQRFFYFKNNYSLRTECGRYNFRFKNTEQERMRVRNESPIANLNTPAHISLLAVATVTSNPTHSYRKLKAVKRTALLYPLY